MCYSYLPVQGETGIDYKPRKEIEKLIQEGRILTSPDGYHYPKKEVGSLVNLDNQIQVIPMRFDFIYRKYLNGYPDFDLAMVVKKKNSRAINPETRQKWGYDSYNARLDTIDVLWSFRDSWAEGKRCVMPVYKFKERPNMDEAPKEHKGREYLIDLQGRDDLYMAGIWDKFERKGQSICSLAILTTESEASQKMVEIYHDRFPIILRQSQVEEWLDMRTKPERAKEMCRLYPEDEFSVIEILKEPKNEPATDGPAMEDPRLPLW